MIDVVTLWWHIIVFLPLIQGTSIRGPSLYVVMAKIIQPPPKFVVPEWIYGCRFLYANAEAERAAAERLIMESQRTMEDRKKTTEHLVFDNKKRTGESSFNSRWISYKYLFFFYG